MRRWNTGGLTVRDVSYVGHISRTTAVEERDEPA